MGHKSYVDMVVEKWKGTLVDCYMGDSNGVHLTAEREFTRTSFLRGTIISGSADCLILLCSVDNKTLEVLVNSWNIKSICPVVHEKFNIGKLYINGK